MEAKIEKLKEKGAAKKKAIDDNRAKLDAKGYKPEKYEVFTAALDDLNNKDAEQEKSVELAESKTAEQNAVKDGCTELAGKTFNAAKSAFNGDQKMLKLFKVDEKIPRALKPLGVFCQYLGNTAQENKAVMLDNGLEEEDITNLQSAPIRLEDADTAQGSALKAQKTATILRDQAGDKVKSEITKIESFVKAKFQKDTEMLVAFDVLPKPRGRKSSKNTKPPTPPAQ